MLCSIISIQRTPLIGTALPQLYLLLFREIFCRATLRQTSLSVSSPQIKCQQEEPISLSILKAMVHKISFDSISGSAGASEIYLDIFCPLGGYDQVRRHLCDSDPSNNITKESELRAFEGSFQPGRDGANLEALMVSAA